MLYYVMLYVLATVLDPRYDTIRQRV